MFKFAESEHPRITNREIIFEEFQPLRYTNVTDGRRQTDDMRSQDQTTLCTKVRRAVKMGRRTY